MPKTKGKIDFGGYVTRYNVRCSDGRVIQPGAFKHHDGARIPLMWQHQITTPENIMGSVYLTHRDDGLYGEASLNSSRGAIALKEAIAHGDVRGLSIFANNLRETGNSVTHGQIIEASVVLLGANPGAHIDDVSLSHSAEGEHEAILGWVEEESLIIHADTPAEPVTPPSPEVVTPPPAEPETPPAPAPTLSDQGTSILTEIKGGMSISEAKVKYPDYFSNLNDVELDLFKEGLGDLSAELAHSALKGDIMPRIFNQSQDGDQSVVPGKVLKHDQYLAIVQGAKQHGSLRASILAHAATYGFEPVELLFPKPENQPSDPIVIQRQTAWVADFFGRAFKSPFASVRTLYADITKKEARARGYLKGNLKYEQVIELLQRYSRPCTVYAKQALDHDDLVDITEYAVVEFLWKVMELSLNEELARAALLGDGRLVGDPDKIKEDCIRPIYKEHPFFAKRIVLPATVGEMTAAEWLKMVDAVAQARRFYRGSGNPTFYTTPEFLAFVLTLREPTTGMRYYATIDELKAQMRVSDIQEVPLMEAVTREEGETEIGLVGIVVNPSDYTFGNTKLGQLATFQDFDIDWNKHKFLMETRRSGGLTLPMSALIIEKIGWATEEEPPLDPTIDDTAE